MHRWNFIVEEFEQADLIVIDLDPGEGVRWEAVADTALELRALIERKGLDTWPKLTGGKGVHVMAPLHDHAHRIARGLCSETAARDPSLISFRHRRGGLAGSFSTICATAAARLQSAPIHPGLAKAFQSPRYSLSSNDDRWRE